MGNVGSGRWGLVERQSGLVGFEKGASNEFKNLGYGLAVWLWFS